MNGFEKRRERKKEFIMNAALELFNKFGFGKVTIAEIAKKASVSQVSIYNFFESKDNLKLEIIKRMIDQNTDKLLEVVKEQMSIGDKLEKFLSLKIDFIRNGNLAFFSESVENDSYLKSLVFEFSEKVRGILKEIIKEGQRIAYFRRDISMDSILLYIEMYQNSIISNEKLMKDSQVNPRIAEEMYMLFWDGLRER